MPLLVVEGLSVRFASPEGEVCAASDISFALEPGDAVGVVGESGSGKSQVFLALMGLLAKNGRAQGRVTFEGQELLGLAPRALNALRGARLAMVFQDPLTSLNPYLKVSRQMTEVLVAHQGMGEDSARAAAIEMLERVHIPDARRRFDLYPHEFSGGMRQRVMIATALLCGPRLLIADEPTTALDVTVQAQILDLLRELRASSGTAIVLITHDLGVVAGLCDRVMVMYGGRIVEDAPAQMLFHAPHHPYTAGLLDSVPRIDAGGDEPLTAIAGQPPNLQALPPGCAFAARCGHAHARCDAERPLLKPIAAGHRVACHLEAAPP